MTAYSDFSVTQGGNVSAGNQNQNMINIRHIINGTDATAAPADSLVSLRTGISDASPIGSLCIFPLTIDSNYLSCDGSAVSRTTYSSLFDYISTAYGNGDGSTTFNIPDYRGYFLRMTDGGAGNDPDAGSRTDRGDGTTGDNVGTKQTDENKLHGHTFTTSDDPGASGGAGGLVTQNSGINNRSAYTGTSSNNTGQQIGGSGGNESRPLNAYVNIGIRYQ